MENQTELFGKPKPASGKDLRDKGIKKAVDHADQVHGEWQSKAWVMFEIYLEAVIGALDEFMIEDFRKWSREQVPIPLPDPPSNRAFGSIAVRAQKAGLIHAIGFRSVKNARAHCAPCRVWKKVIH